MPQLSLRVMRDKVRPALARVSTWWHRVPGWQRQWHYHETGWGEVLPDTHVVMRRHVDGRWEYRGLTEVEADEWLKIIAW